MSDEKSRSPLSVLGAEDSVTQSKVISLAIERSPNLQLIDIVQDGQELLDYLSDNPDCIDPDLILLDANLPRLDGLEALRELKSSRVWRSIPVVMLFGNHDEQEIARAYQLGSNTCIVKPITVEDFGKLFLCLGNYWSLAASPMND